jgi:hypothetical protein
MELHQCGWATLLDDEPFPEPKQNLQYSNEQEYLGGWKLVGGITVTGSIEDEGSMVLFNVPGRSNLFSEAIIGANVYTG